MISDSKLMDAIKNIDNNPEYPSYNGIIFDVEWTDDKGIDVNIVNECLKTCKDAGLDVIFCTAGWGPYGSHEVGHWKPNYNLDWRDINFDYIDLWMLMMYALGNDSNDTTKGFGKEAVVQCFNFNLNLPVSSAFDPWKGYKPGGNPIIPPDKLSVAWSFPTKAGYDDAMNQPFTLDGKTAPLKDFIGGEFYWMN